MFTDKNVTAHEELIDPLRLLDPGLPPAKREDGLKEMVQIVRLTPERLGNLKKYFLGALYRTCKRDSGGWFLNPAAAPTSLRSLADYLRARGLWVSHMTISRAENLFTNYSCDEIDRYRKIPACALQEAAGLPDNVRRKVLEMIRDRLEQGKMKRGEAAAQVQRELDRAGEPTLGPGEKEWIKDPGRELIRICQRIRQYIVAPVSHAYEDTDTLAELRRRLQADINWIDQRAGRGEPSE